MKPTQEQVIAWAREAGYIYEAGRRDEREAFAAQTVQLVRDAVAEAKANEREECAKAVEEVYGHQDIETKYAGLVGSVLMDCAAAIRARGEKNE